MAAPSTAADGACEQVMKLDKFIADSMPQIERQIASRQHVSEPGFNVLYVRITQRYFDGARAWPVLDIATVEVCEDQRGQGIFTRLLSRVRRTYPQLHLYVENAEPRLARRLLQLGFRQYGTDEQRSYFLASTDELRLGTDHAD